MDVAAVLGYARTTWPYFNASLRQTHPNHLLLFPGDMAMDLPRPRMQPPLSPEVDASQVSASNGPEWPRMASDGLEWPRWPLISNPMHSNPMHANPMHANPMHANPMHAERRDPHDTLSRSHLLVIRRLASYLAKTWCSHRRMISREGRQRMIAAARRRRAARRGRRGGGGDDHPASQIASTSRARSRARPGDPL